MAFSCKTKKNKNAENDKNLEMLLPNPNVEVDEDKVRTITTTIICVQGILQLSNRKRGGYGHYTDKQRAKIAKYAFENGNTYAAKHFSKLMERKINESTLHSSKWILQ